MFRITHDPSSRSNDSYLTKTTCSGSTVLVVCAVGIWRHIKDLWCVCVLRRIESYCTSQYSLMMDPACSESCWSNFNVWFILKFYLTQILISTTSRFECISWLIKVSGNKNYIVVDTY
jgi:hypothetical protein